MKTIVFFLAVRSTMVAAPHFTAVKTTDQGIEIIRLADTLHQVEVSLVPSLGNRVYEFKVHGKNLLYFPTTLTAFKESGGKAFNGIPFLAPWGNRIQGGGFWANGKRYAFNIGLNNLSVYRGIAIHGMLAASPLWDVTAVSANKMTAHVTSRLQFWRYPDLLANWPFAHEYEVTYTLSDKGLEAATTVTNLGAEPMPVAIGFHPYFNIPETPRAECTAHIAARKHVDTDADLIPSGLFSDAALADQVSLKDRTFDDGFTDLERDSANLATFSVQAAGKKIEVMYGPKYRVAIVYAPPNQNYICFEPMAGITNAVNLAHDGKYGELQTVAPKSSWQESFWIRFSGF